MRHLTCLQVECSRWDPDFGQVKLGTVLQHLQALKHLHLQYARLSKADVMLLSVLTKLTHLSLPNAGAGVDDFVVATLASKMMDVSSCGLQEPVVLTALAGLTKLHKLNIYGNTLVVGDEGLLLLTDLVALTALCIPERHKVSKQARMSFVVAMPCLDKVDGASVMIEAELEWEELLDYEEDVGL
jgi:hypothetical protein